MNLGLSLISAAGAGGVFFPEMTSLRRDPARKSVFFADCDFGAGIEAEGPVATGWMVILPLLAIDDVVGDADNDEDEEEEAEAEEEEDGVVIPLAATPDD